MDPKVRELVAREFEKLCSARDIARQRIAQLNSEIDELNRELDSIEETEKQVRKQCLAVETFLRSIDQ